MFAAGLLNRLDRRLADLTDGVQERLERARERRQLLALDDRMLHDIGLTRGALDRPRPDAADPDDTRSP